MPVPYAEQVRIEDQQDGTNYASRPRCRGTLTHCLKFLDEKSLARAEEALREGMPLILLERLLHCHCGARVGVRQLPSGKLVPTRHAEIQPKASLKCYQDRSRFQRG